MLLHLNNTISQSDFTYWYALCSSYLVERWIARWFYCQNDSEKRSMWVVIIMWYMCRRSEKQQINIPAKDFPWDISWKYQRPKIRTLIMCLALVVKLLYVFSSAEDRAVFFSISWWNLSWTKKPTTETGSMQLNEWKWGREEIWVAHFRLIK